MNIARDDLIMILAEADPVGLIANGAPRDEYAAEADAIYTRRCVPEKARLDLMYARNRSVCFDLVLIWRTMRRVLH